MNAKQVSKNFADMVDLASKMRSATDADALLVMVNGPADWQLLKRRSRSYLVLVAGNDSQQMHDASEAGLPTVLLESDETPVLEQLSRALLASVAVLGICPGALFALIHWRLRERWRLAGALQSLLGPGYIMNPHRHCHLNPPGGKGQSWHKDCYVFDHNLRHPRFRWVMAFYYPQDTTPDMGPTGVLPGQQWYRTISDPDPKAASGESLRHPTARLAGAPDCQSGSRPLGVSCCVGHVVLHMHRSLLCVQTETADEDFQLQTTWRLMASEAHDLRPGGETVITRLADILVIQAIRSSRTLRRRARCIAPVVYWSMPVRFGFGLARRPCNWG